MLTLASSFLMIPAGAFPAVSPTINDQQQNEKELFFHLKNIYIIDLNRSLNLTKII